MHRGLACLALCLPLLALGAAAPGAGAAPGTSAVRAATPKSTAAAREGQMMAVVRAWSARLNANDDAGVARLFALPSVVVQGPYAYRLRTRAQVARWHSGLPCSGRIVSIEIRGRFATAVFRLGNRGTTRCDAPGTLAAARFEIVGGKIRMWMQVPVPEEKADTGPVA
jgi:hypothetical protein